MYIYIYVYIYIYLYIDLKCLIFGAAWPAAWKLGVLDDHTWAMPLFQWDSSQAAKVQFLKYVKVPGKDSRKPLTSDSCWLNIMEVVLSVTPTLSSQIHGNIYIYIYICGNHFFNDFCQGVQEWFHIPFRWYSSKLGYWEIAGWRTANERTCWLPKRDCEASKVVNVTFGYVSLQDFSSGTMGDA